MSLKAFHLIFIVASVLLTVAFGIWGINQYASGGPRSDLLMGIVSLLMGIGLVVYGKYFLRKLKHISYL
jgi:hypothetical protein